MMLFLQIEKKHSISSSQNPGQGLVEYALILVLVAVVVIVILTIMGGSVTNSFCGVVNVLSDDIPARCAEDVVEITSSDFNAGKGELKLQATTNGGYNPDIVLITSPGGTMAQQGSHYAITVSGLTGCPCTVTVRSSKGGRDSVTVP